MAGLWKNHPALSGHSAGKSPPPPPPVSQQPPHQMCCQQHSPRLERWPGPGTIHTATSPWWFGGEWPRAGRPGPKYHAVPAGATPRSFCEAPASPESAAPRARETPPPPTQAPTEWPYQSPPPSPAALEQGTPLFAPRQRRMPRNCGFQPSPCAGSKGRGSLRGLGPGVGGCRTRPAEGIRRGRLRRCPRCVPRLCAPPSPPPSPPPAPQ
mmetsp:Transcript_24201/g.55250  ORF Transcript_24201/g.55250 Transcript_24201/m.55250 type:complete len:210 (-) Transcript_24201:18-647(-)